MKAIDIYLQKELFPLELKIINNSKWEYETRIKLKEKTVFHYVSNNKNDGEDCCKKTNQAFDFFQEKRLYLYSIQFDNAFKKLNRFISIKFQKSLTAVLRLFKKNKK